MTNSTLITDDRKMFEKATEIGIKTIFLRDIENSNGALPHA